MVCPTATGQAAARCENLTTRSGQEQKGWLRLGKTEEATAEFRGRNADLKSLLLPYKIREKLQQRNLEVDPEPIVRAAFQTIAKHVTQGETQDAVHSFPKELKDLWTESVQA